MYRSSRACLFSARHKREVLLQRARSCNARKTVECRAGATGNARNNGVASYAREKEGEREAGGRSGERARERRDVIYIQGILLYTACIITLRCTCELFPPRLTRPIHNGMTAAKVLPVIAPRAPPSRPNIVRPTSLPPPPPPDLTSSPSLPPPPLLASPPQDGHLLS